MIGRLRGFRRSEELRAAARPIPGARRDAGAKVYLPPIREILGENARLRRENVELRIQIDRAKEEGGESRG